MREWLDDTLYWCAKVATEGIGGMLIIFALFAVMVAIISALIWCGTALWMAVR